eukprot:TRINITY_DN13922_c0_g1_i2.p1 TRINITY_DN13922_c0_g1~~TRINITY_DN13922_c0_g1_i2.p1  ORF type:complete len:291 (+),score=51.60 TRINITY_DN13922_c0_g1_i2:199-1071(+)
MDFDPWEFFRGDEAADDPTYPDLLVVLHPAKSLGRTPLFKALNDFAAAAPELKRKRGLIVSHCRGCAWADQVLRRWHIEEEQLPYAVLFPQSREEGEEGRFHLNMSQWSSAEDFQAALQGFLERYDAGKEHHFVYSQPIPLPEDQDMFVREVVGDSFQTEVLDRLTLNISTLMLFYKPWCGWCRQVQPVFKAIGKQLGRGNPLLRVARMDMDQNEKPPNVHAETHSVPAIYLFTPSHSLHPVFHTDGHQRTVENIMGWCKRNVPDLEAWLAGNHSSSAAEDSGFGGLEDL